MASFGKILLPVDFSERSLDAARQAEVMARHFHSDVTVLHVVDPDQPSGRLRGMVSRSQVLQLFQTRAELQA
jgi:nucleotide-binding universal stress UspA family protein